MFVLYMRCSARAPKYQLNLYSHRCKTTTTKPKPSARSPTISSPLPRGNVGRSRAEQIQMLAGRMLDAGHNEIYRNTAANGFVGTSIGIMIMSCCGLGYLYSTRLWDSDVAKARGLQWFVPIGYQIAMMSWGIFIMYPFTKTLGIVKSIKLIRNADKVLLETSIRRPVPFMRPEKHLSEPHELIINRAKLFGSIDTEGMITASEGKSFLSKFSRALFYKPFHNTRKALGGVGLVPIQVGEDNTQRRVILDVDGQFSNGGQDILDISKDEI